MRVVHQLISYFRDHGALSERQLEELRVAGFLPEGDDETSGSDRMTAGDREDRSAQDGASDFGRDGERLATIGAQKRRKPLGIDPLCHKLLGISHGWENGLESFVEIANGIAPAETWQQSALVIRRAGEQQLRDVVEAAISRQAVALSALSVSLDLHAYRQIWVQGPQRTRALSAYRALLRTHDFSSLGKYAWILKHEPVNNVFNLIQAKRAILGALNEIFDNRQDALTTRFHGHAATNLFWAFVILRSAKSEDPWLESRRKSAASATYLDKLWPPREVLQRAGLYALFMAPDAVLSFLTSDFDVPEDARGNPPWIIPRTWTSPSEKHYIDFRQ